MLKVFIGLLLFACSAFAENAQEEGANIIGNNMARCAKSFIGRPYDMDPIGIYVRKNVIVYDDKMDCMYLVFRCAELALSNFNSEAAENEALKMRFKTIGVIDGKKTVINYDNRFEYGEDMVYSPKWGKNITKEVAKEKGDIAYTHNSTGYANFEYVPKNKIKMEALRNGDIVFFVKNEDRRTAEEIIGHMGIVVVESDGVYVIHAHGSKLGILEGSGVVKVLLQPYIQKATRFVGIAVKRI